MLKLNSSIALIPSVLSMVATVGFTMPSAISATPNSSNDQVPFSTPNNPPAQTAPPLHPISSPSDLETDPPTLAQALPSLEFLTQVKHGNNVNAIGFSNDGQYLATTGGDRFIRVWHINSVLVGDEDSLVPIAIAVPENDGYITSMTFAPGDRYLVTATFNGNVRVWDLQNCDPDPEIHFCTSNVLLDRNYKGVAPVVRFSPDGQRLAASNYDGTVTLWDWSSRQIVAVLEAETGAHNGDQIDGRFSSISFSPDGQFLAAGSHDTTITVWTLEDFERVGVIETGHGVDSVAFSPDSEWLASGNLYGVELRTIRVSRGRLKIDEELQMDGLARVNTLTFDATGQTLLGGDNRNNVLAWDLEEEEMLTLIPPQHQHERPILSVDLTSNGSLLASSSTDGIIKLWQP